MTDKELKKLSRTDLLQLLVDQSRENEELEKKLNQAMLQFPDGVETPEEEKSVDEEVLEPDTSQLEAELVQKRYRQRYGKTLRSTIYILITVAAAAVLVATLWLPVLQIYGSSMSPTLNDGEFVISLKNRSFEQGDIVAFYYNNKVLVKRVIAGPGDWVNIRSDGTVTVNDSVLEEPYLTEKAFGECNIELPYQVPDAKIFVMGDHRSVSIDSRNTAVGCVANEQIVGKLLFRFWPLQSIGELD